MPLNRYVPGIVTSVLIFFFFFFFLMHRRIQGDTLYMCEQFGVNGTLYFYVMRTSCFMAKPRNGPHHHTHQVRLRGLVSSLVSIVCVASLNNK